MESCRGRSPRVIHNPAGCLSTPFGVAGLSAAPEARRSTPGVRHHDRKNGSFSPCIWRRGQSGKPRQLSPVNSLSNSSTLPSVQRCGLLVGNVPIHRQTLSRLTEGLLAGRYRRKAPEARSYWALAGSRPCDGSTGRLAGVTGV